MEPHIAAFWNRGMVVIDNFLDEEAVEAIKAAVRSLAFAPIFLRVDSEEMDPNRLMASVPVSGQLSAINVKMKELASWFTDDWEISAWTALKSLPGGETQQVHRDFPTFETSKAILTKQWVQGSVIVALCDQATVETYPGCFNGAALREAKTTVVIKKGDALLFRGDLPHAGCRYDEENLRLHCYLRVKDVAQLPNATEAVAFATFFCEFCLASTVSKRAKQNHERYCSQNPERKENEKRRRAINDMGAQCDRCGRHFNKKNTRDRHRRTCQISSADMFGSSDSELSSIDVDQFLDQCR
ncbi:hypothetical protein ATCC90586_000772 [Pythium insidiosum]|nr:hypothetical protein ATCC90586_000772 [Pythium insidiosum]